MFDATQNGCWWEQASLKTFRPVLRLFAQAVETLAWILPLPDELKGFDRRSATSQWSVLTIGLESESQAVSFGPINISLFS